jgi:hypothetical protein
MSHYSVIRRAVPATILTIVLLAASGTSTASTTSTSAKIK